MMGVLIGLIILVVLITMAFGNHKRGVKLRENAPFWAALIVGSAGIVTFTFLLLEQGNIG